MQDRQTDTFPGSQSQGGCYSLARSQHFTEEQCLLSVFTLEGLGAGAQQPD